ncbi:GNAT family N-acetyltransferase [Shimia sp. FJ5]|uniref:GNAT family N-acetyltransferase n=1 Tax=Shimia sp. FJ5 TaxID=3079054 RepID=UPI00260CF6C9|nr:GNAT family N-acetyltransferase [Shimia sp. FJ5]MDV4146051.1 GNAT family N-acetyltransferase [Shimia sp. FJ5]
MSSEIHIRPARPADRSAVTQLFRRAYPPLLAPDYDPGVLRAALPLITTAQPALLDCGTYFVAEDAAGRVVGAGGWTDVSPARGVGAERQGHVRHVATDPGRLRQGVARRLVETSLASAREFGMERLHCMSTRTAQSFYHAMGFKPVGEIELTLAPGVYFPAVQMQRGL